MPRPRPTPIGIALTAWELWHRLPPAQRRQVLRATRTYGPRIGAALLAMRRARKL